jgi:23S rRNA (pseudouridine1915-N3)-methyltransferase
VKLAVISVGRLKDGPERDLVERYRERVEALGRSQGLSPLQLVEIPEGRGRRDDERRVDEGASILDKAGASVVVAFDERGRSVTSEAFAQRIGAWRDEGRDRIAFVIGGPDGLDQRVRDGADLVIAFGTLTLPHQVVRALVVEQLYRALTILAGHPYHRTGSKEP